MSTKKRGGGVAHPPRGQRPDRGRSVSVGVLHVGAGERVATPVLEWTAPLVAHGPRHRPALAAMATRRDPIGLGQLVVETPGLPLEPCHTAAKRRGNQNGTKRRWYCRTCGGYYPRVRDDEKEVDVEP